MTIPVTCPLIKYWRPLNFQIRQIIFFAVWICFKFNYMFINIYGHSKNPSECSLNEISAILLSVKKGICLDKFELPRLADSNSLTFCYTTCLHQLKLWCLCLPNLHSLYIYNNVYVYWVYNIDPLICITWIQILQCMYGIMHFWTKGKEYYLYIHSPERG